MEDSSKPPRDPSSSSRGGGNSNNKRRPRRTGGGGSGNRRRGGPQLQQVKLVFRNIGDLERYGTVAKIIEMVQSIFDRVNDEKTKTFWPIVLEESSVQCLIESERLVAERAAKDAASTGAEADVEGKEKATVGGDDKDGDEPMTETAEEIEPEERKTESSEVVTESKNVEETLKFSEVVKGPMPEIKGPTLNARALYVVPPKKSRRRGIKSGCAFVILASPPPAMSANDEMELSPTERSRVTAKARLQLNMAVEALSKHAEHDAKSTQSYGGCIIQPSLSGKTWKPQYRDSRDGTIESTADYQKFIDNQAQEEADRRNRPKPTPGGASFDESKADSADQVAALVAHLRSKKQQEAKRKKTARNAPVAKQARGGKGPTGGKKKAGSGKNSRGGGGGGNPNKRGGGGGRNKVGGNNSVSMPVVLKTGGG